MSRPKLERPDYKLITRPGRRKWYVTWTDPQTGGSRYASTGIEVDPAGEDAPQPCQAARAALAAFIEESEAPSDTPTVRELMAKRLAHWKGKRERKKQAVDAVESLHRFVNGYFGDLQVEQLTPEKVGGYQEHRRSNTKLAAGATPITAITRELEELRTALLFAFRNRWIEEIPDIELPAPRPPRTEFMTRAEGKRLIKAAKAAHLRLFILIALTTGQRKTAILELTWERVDFKRGILDFRNPEEQLTKKVRGVCAVPRSLIVELQRAYKLRSQKTDRVIEFRGKPVRDVKKAFAEAAVDAGLVRPAKRGQDPKPWVTPHTCKHTVISWLAEAGWTVDQISDFTSTDQATVRRVYRKVNPSALHGLRDTLAGIVFPAQKRVAGRVSPTAGRRNAKRRNGLTH